MAASRPLSLQEHCDAICQSASGKLLMEFPAIGGTTPRLSGWSDEKLRELRRGFTYGRIPTFRAELPDILKRFYNFYLSGTIQSTDNLLAIVSDACLCSQVSDTVIFPRDIVDADHFYKVNTSTANLLAADSLFGASPQLVFPATIRTKADKAAYRLHADTYADKKRVFLARIGNIIQGINIQGEATDEESKLIRLTGFLALTLWRAATKTKQQMANVFLKNQYKLKLRDLTSWPIQEAFSPPCDACLEKCTLALFKGLPTTSNMFTAIVHAYVESRTPPVNNYIAEYLSASVLTHTACNGLGMIEMLEQCMSITKKNWVELCELTSFDITEAHWDKIRDFFLLYHQKGHEEYGFYWARIINDGYLRDYSPKEMLYLAAIFAGIIEQDQGPGIWQAKWAKGRKHQLENLRRIGETVYLSTLEKQKKKSDTRRAEEEEYDIEAAIAALPDY